MGRPRRKYKIDRHGASGVVHPKQYYQLISQPQLAVKVNHEYLAYV